MKTVNTALKDSLAGIKDQIKLVKEGEPIPHPDRLEEDSPDEDTGVPIDLVALLKAIALKQEEQKKSHEIYEADIKYFHEKLSEMKEKEELEEDSKTLHRQNLENKQQRNNSILTAAVTGTLVTIIGCTVAMMFKSCINTSDAPKFKV